MTGKIKLCNIYYLLLAIYTVDEIFSESQLVNIITIAHCLTFIRYLLLGFLIFFILYRDICSKKIIIAGLSTILIFTLLNLLFKGSGISLISIILFVLASKNYSLKKIFKTMILSLLSAHVFVILLAFAGVLQDTVTERYIGYSSSFLGGLYQRHNMGFLVHNQIPLFFLIYYFYIIIYKRENIKLIENIIYMIANYIVFTLFGARIVFILVFVTCLGYYLIKFLRKFKLKRISIPWHLSYPLLAIISLFLSLGYNDDSTFWNNLNLFFNNRIKFSNQALSYYGINLMGVGRNLVGNTVDNGYISITLINGIILAMLFIGIWTYLTWIAEKKHNSYMVFILVMLALENLINAHLGSFKLLPLFCILVNNNDPFLIGTSNGVSLNRSIFSFKRIKFVIH